MFKKLFDFFVYGSIYTALCAVIMVYQTADLLELGNTNPYLYEFVFFSSIAAYNFHWILTPFASSSTDRRLWTVRNKGLQVVLLLVGVLGTIVYFFPLSHYWMWIAVSGTMTFLYSAPKLPYTMADRLQKIAVGKTIYLALVWTYVTTILPLLMSQKGWLPKDFLFTGYRFFLIYAICILFDYRDREMDKEAGILSIVTILDARKTDWLFYLICAFTVADTLMLLHFHWTVSRVAGLLVPLAILVFLYPYAKKKQSDYLYYFVLDGLMMFSAFFTTIF